MALIAGGGDQEGGDGEDGAAMDTDALARLYAAVVQGMSVQAIDGASAADLDAIATIAIAHWPQRWQSS